MNKRCHSLNYKIIIFTHAAKYVHLYHCGLQTKHTFAAIPKRHESNSSKNMTLLDDFPSRFFTFLLFHF